MKNLEMLRGLYKTSLQLELSYDAVEIIKRTFSSLKVKDIKESRKFLSNVPYRNDALTSEYSPKFLKSNKTDERNLKIEYLTKYNNELKNKMTVIHKFFYLFYKNKNVEISNFDTFIH